MPKTLKGLTEPYMKHVVNIDHKGKTYSVPVENNLVLRQLSSSDVKKHLNELPGKLVYWVDSKLDLEIELEELTEEYDDWYRQEYMNLDAPPKATEAWKKSKVILDNVSTYKDYQARMRELRHTISKIGVLTTGYNTQVWTLRETAKLVASEMSNIELRGKGSLGDL